MEKFVSHLSAGGLSAASLFHFLRATKITFLGKSYFSEKLLSTLFSKYTSVTRRPVETKIQNSVRIGPHKEELRYKYKNTKHRNTKFWPHWTVHKVEVSQSKHVY